MSAAAATAATAEIPAMDAVENATSVDELLAQIKLLNPADLAKVARLVTSQFEKFAKAAAKPARAKKEVSKKANPKRVDQLKKPREWVTFVLQHSLQNGWEAFSIKQTKTDKPTKQKVEEIIDMPASECVEGVHYYAGTVDPETGKGKPMITKHAMSLSKIYWSNKDQTGTRKDLYDAFEAQFSEADIYSAPSEIEEVPKPIVVRKTASQKAREAEEAKAAKTAAKEAAKAAKAEAKAAKDAEKAEVKAVAPKKTTKPASAPAPDAAPAPAPAASAAAPAKKSVVKKPTAAKKADTFTCEDDGEFHEWTWDGQKYWRDFQGRCFRYKESGITADDWVGIWIRDELRFDTTAPYPKELEDDE
jgi:hypothetical protein